MSVDVRARPRATRSARRSLVLTSREPTRHQPIRAGTPDRCVPRGSRLDFKFYVAHITRHVGELAMASAVKILSGTRHVVHHLPYRAPDKAFSLDVLFSTPLYRGPFRHWSRGSTPPCFNSSVWIDRSCCLDRELDVLSS